MTNQTVNENKLIIRGLTEEGRKFRPSDWAERLCGNLCTFRNRRIYYSPLLRPSINQGVKCILVDKSLATSHPELYNEIIMFAKKNKLQTNLDAVGHNLKIVV